MTTDVAERDQEVRGKHYGSGLAQVTMLLAPIFAAFFQQQLAYMLLTWACSRGLVILVHLPTLLALVIIGASALAAQRTLARVGARSPGDERSSDGRARFLAAATLVLAAFSLLLTLGQWLPTLFIHPCQR